MSYDPLLLTTGDTLELSGSAGDLLLSTSEGEEGGGLVPLPAFMTYVHGTRARAVPVPTGEE